MSESPPPQPSRYPTMLVAEAAFALALVAIGVVVVADSLRIGAGWGDDGPQAGYFPFYVGAMLIVSGIVTAVQTVRYEGHWRRAFASREQLARVGAVLAPTALYVAAIFALGLYVSSALFIAWFMVRHGRFRWVLTLPVSVGVPLAIFVVFERWFLVSLPKGPLEQALGF